MLKINLNTGLAWTKSIMVDGSLNDDLLALIDEYYSENGELPVRMYTMDEINEIYEHDENDIDDALENMIPINGGEYWIDGIDSIEEIK